jgi:hypothetical protein
MSQGKEQRNELDHQNRWYVYVYYASICNDCGAHFPCFMWPCIDYKLRRINGSVAADTSREEDSIIHKEKFGSNVTLLCSSSLTGVNDSVLDIPVVFVFNSSGTNKSGGCMNTGNVATEANWITNRQSFPPYECTLTIVDFGSKDIGEYQCAGLLPREDDSQYEKDWSKVTVTLLSRDLPKKLPKRESKYMPLISIGAVLLLFIPSFLLYKKFRKRSQRDHRPNLAHTSSTTSEFFFLSGVILLALAIDTYFY